VIGTRPAVVPHKITRTRDKILFVSHDLVPVGGGGAVASWMVQSLVSAYDVTVLSWNAPDFDALDQMFGTSLAGAPIKTERPSRVERWLIDCIPDNCCHQRANYLLRMAKRHGQEFRALVGCSFEFDFGRPGIQYVHYPYLCERSGAWTLPGDAPPGARIRGLFSRRLPPWMLISGYSFERVRSNLTLTNSRWTLGQIRTQPGADAEVLYPPAPGDFPDIPWEQREDAFACIGRLEPPKRQDWIIETLALVRREWPSLQLHLCGFKSSLDFMRRLDQLAKMHGSWVHIHSDLSRTDMVKLLSRCRYGIHANIDEHFGIGPAELARAGCIPFVHASGGQVEIVDRDPRLCYTTAEDAATKILAVLRDTALQDELRAAVSHRSQLFTPEAFVQGFLSRVSDFLEGQR